MSSLKEGKEGNGSILNATDTSYILQKVFLFLKRENLNNLWSRVYIIILELFPRHLEVSQ